MATKKMDNDIDVLKKPSQFVTHKLSTNINLKSPSNFCVDKSNTKTDVKKPSDFFLYKENNHTQTKKLLTKGSLAVPNEVGSSVDYKSCLNNNTQTDLSTARKISGLSLPNNRNKKQSSHENIGNLNLFKLPKQIRSHPILKGGKGVASEHLCQGVITKATQDAGTQCNPKGVSDLELSISSLSDENSQLRKRIEEADRVHFNEMKSVYDKYIALQAQSETEKCFLMSKIVRLEEMLQESTCTNEQYDKHVQQLTSQNAQFKDCLTTNTSVLLETKHNLQSKVEELENEKLKVLQQLEKATTTLNDVNKELRVRNDLINKLQIEMEDCKRETQTHEENSLKLQGLLSDSVKKVETLNHENELIRVQSHEKELLICSLQKTIDDSKIQLANAKEEAIEEQKSSQMVAESKQREIEILQHTCKTLQTANETLNVRLNSLNEILVLQESTLGEVVDKSKNEKLVRLWRQKVYSLLVLLKTYEIREHSKVKNNQNDFTG